MRDRYRNQASLSRLNIGTSRPEYLLLRISVVLAIVIWMVAGACIGSFIAPDLKILAHSGTFILLLHLLGIVFWIETTQIATITKKHRSLLAEYYTFTASPPYCSYDWFYRIMLLPIVQTGLISPSWAQPQPVQYINSVLVTTFFNTRSPDWDYVHCLAIQTDDCFDDSKYRVYSFGATSIFRAHMQRGELSGQLLLLNDHSLQVGNHALTMLIRYFSDSYVKPLYVIAFRNLVAVLYGQVLPIDHLCAVVDLQDRIVYCQKLTG